MKNKQYLVFGLGRFGSSMARALCAQGQEVLAVDSDQELVNQIAPHVTQALQLDATDEEALRSLGVKNFDAAVVAIGQNTRDSILVSVLLKEMGIPYLIAKANDDLCAELKDQTEKLLASVLYTTSCAMRNGFAMSDNER